MKLWNRKLKEIDDLTNAYHTSYGDREQFKKAWYAKARTIAAEMRQCDENKANKAHCDKNKAKK